MKLVRCGVKTTQSITVQLKLAVSTRLNNSKIGLLALACIVATGSVFSQWNRIETGASPMTYFDHIECPDPLTCYVAGEEQVMKTTDGGEIWIDVSNGLVPSTSIAIKQFICLDKNTCYLAGYEGYFHKTTDGGASWQTVSFGDFGDPSCLTFVSPQISYAIESFTGVLYKSIDGCNTWNPVTHDLPIAQNKAVNLMVFTSEQVGHVLMHDVNSGVLQKYIYKTTDGGNTWVQKFQDSLISGALTRFHFVNEQVGYMSASPYGYLLKTTDGGETWTDISIPEHFPQGGIGGIDFLDENNGYVTGSMGTIFKTTNGGDSWIEESYSQPFSLYDVAITNLDTVYISTKNNTVLKNENANFTAGLFDHKQLQYGSLYPNPVQDKLTIKIDASLKEDMSFLLYDITGKEVANIALTQNTTQWNCQHVQPGTYLYKIIENYSSTRQVISVGKLIIE